MPASLSRSLGLPTLPGPVPVPPLKMQEDHIHGFGDQSQGMISILTSSYQSSSTANTSALRRTLSAEMSSKTWTPQSQSCIKKVPSVEHLHHDDNDGSGTGDGSESPAFDEIWNSIQREQKNKDHDMERPRQVNIWSSILSQKANNEGEKQSLPPPYVHPLVKRSASSLSEKSLEICTESLGSETGSDGFSSYPASEQEDKDEADRNQEAETQSHQQDHAYEKEVYLSMSMEDEVRVSAPRNSYSASMATPKKATNWRSFPPPLPSLGHRGDGANLHMRSHRGKGRLVLEAVSVPSHNCFRAQRQDGRLLLTFSSNHPSAAHGSTEEEKEDDHMLIGDDEESDEWEEEEEDEEDKSMMMEINVNKELQGRCGMINYVQYKFMTLARSNTPPWSHRLNKVVTTLEDALPDPVPMLIPTSTTACLNTYVYSWRTKPRADEAGTINNLQKSVVEVAEAKGAAQVEYLVPILRGCNQQQQQPRKSLLFWEPHCIATS